MKHKQWLWGVLAALIVLLLAACLLPPLPRSKMRASRIQSVNHVASVSMTMPVASGLPAATNSK